MNCVNRVVASTGCFLAIGSAAIAQTAEVKLSGTVVNAQSAPIAGAVASLVRYDVHESTGADGRFSIVTTVSEALDPALRQRAVKPHVKAGVLAVTIAGKSMPVAVKLFAASGRLAGSFVGQSVAPGILFLPLTALSGGRTADGVYVLQVRVGAATTVIRQLIISAHELSSQRTAIESVPFERQWLGRRSGTSVSAETLLVSAGGYQDKAIALTSLDQGDLGVIVLSGASAGANVTVAFDDNVAQLRWAVARLDSELERVNAIPLHSAVGDASADIVVRIDGAQAPASVKAEGFEIVRENSGARLAVVGRDTVGAMYGVLELAEQIRITKSLQTVGEKTHNARFPFRAVKFNLPWSSYRSGEALSLHTQTCRDLKFWEAFLDMMAENRFNALTLWNLHPWPYMIRPTNFPDACPFSDAELAEWKDLWTNLFRMARERGIKPYLVTWNIFVSEAFKKSYDASALTDAGFTGNGTTTEQVRRYNRECVTQVINEYPDLAGLGTSAGDRMANMSPQQAQDWIADVYYGGMKQADREVEFIHRAAFRGTNADIITRNTIEAAGIDAPIWLEMKFNWSHALSTPTLVQIHAEGGAGAAEKYVSPAPTEYKVAWMIRNEDIFVLRWGQADFIRRHIEANGHDYVGGYFLGSETYIPAKDYIHLPGHAHVNWQYEFERKWLMFMQWGRLLYDPQTPDGVFVAECSRRFGAANGEKLFRAWERAGIMPLRFASFMRSTWDYTLYAEGFKQQDFVTLDELIAEDPFDPDFMGIREFVNAGEPASTSQITPVALADEMEGAANEALGLVEGLASGPAAMECEVLDIKMWAHYGLYFANKIRAGIAKAKGDSAGAKSRMAEAVAHWEEMVSINGQHNNQSIPDMQSGTFSWEAMLNTVRAEAN